MQTESRGNKGWCRIAGLCGVVCVGAAVVAVLLVPLARAEARTLYARSVIAPHLFRPDDEHRVVSRWRLLPPLDVPSALRSEMAMLGTLFREGKITRDLYETEIASVRAKLEVRMREGDVQAVEPARGREYYKGAIDTLTDLLESGRITREVYQRQVRMLKDREKAGQDVFYLRGHLTPLIRLYHGGHIDTDTFLKHHSPLWDKWYHIDNILPNGDFENIEDREPQEGMVDFTDWREIRFSPGDSGRSRIDVDRKVKHRGRLSLRFSNDRGPSNILVKSLRFNCLRDDRVKIRFWVKAQGVKRGHHDRAASVHFFKSDGHILWLFIPEGTYDWTMMEARLNAFGNVPEGRVEPCYIEVQFFGEGTLWVDDITIVPTTRAQARLKRRETRGLPGE